jgi:hypothetical protein
MTVEHWHQIQNFGPGLSPFARTGSAAWAGHLSHAAQRAAGWPMSLVAGRPAVGHLGSAALTCPGPCGAAWGLQSLFSHPHAVPRPPGGVSSVPPGGQTIGANT